MLSVTDAVKTEPALAHTAPTLAGAIYAPNDESGDAYKFTDCAWLRWPQSRGVQFLYGTTIRRINVLVVGLRCGGCRWRGRTHADQ